jgi:fucose 4-O-acetylase-like acetyltransferase
MDALRGFAVVLVIFYHAALSVASAGVEPPAFALVMNDLFAPYRMPMLVFLSGMLLGASLRKHAGPYLWGKFSNIGWPYLLWLVPQFFLAPPGEHWKGFLAGGTYLWFLLFIGFYYVVGLVTKRIHPLLVGGAAFVVSIAAEDGSKFGERLFLLLAIFMLGHWYATRQPVSAYVFRTRWLLYVAGAIVVAYFIWMPQGGYQPVSIFASVAGIFLLIRGAMAVEKQSWVAPFREAGKSSLVVYITHVVGMQLLGLLIGDSSDLPAWLLYLMFLAAGVLTAVLFVLGTRRSRGVGYLFSLTPKRGVREKISA